jgi:predicted Rdx family selenoprotein
MGANARKFNGGIHARLHRATWTSTELFVTFPPPALKSITIVPLNAEDAAGRFRIWLTVNEGAPPILVWDRKVEGEFPELKVLVSFSVIAWFMVGTFSNEYLGAP